MTTLAPPFRYDIVGSFLRPAARKEARAQYAADTIDRAELTAVEDDAIRALIAKEKEVGLHAVTDGEFRRSMWSLDFLVGLEGVDEVSADHWSVEFKGNKPKGRTTLITDKIGFGDHPFLDHFRFTKEAAGDTLAKQTIPSPAMLHLMCCVREAGYRPIDRYKDPDALFADLAAAYRDAVAAFYAAGCRYLQFDDTSWGELCDADKRRVYADRGIDLDALERTYVELINESLRDKPADLAVTLHSCRGNFRSTWFSSGGYDPVAPILFPNLHVDGLFLEYDSDRAGGFEPLRYIDGQRVVLGLFTSKSGELEDPDAVKARIREAAEIVPLDQLAVSPQCGFSSTEEGNVLTEDDQWKKLALVRDIARDVWADAE